MKYFTIEELFTNSVGQFLVAVESKEELDEIIQNEYDTYNLSDLIEITYHECEEKDYMKYVEQNTITHIKSYYYHKLNLYNNNNLSIKEYNKLKYKVGNDAKAVLYFEKRLNAYDSVKDKLDLSKISAKEFLDEIENIASK